MYQFRNLRFLFFYIVFLAFPSTFMAQSTEYLWPTEASPYLTSTFGETRSAHFHAGLDIKTWGREGYEVYATRQGKLHRIAIGPDGYGKVIYLEHDDGTFSLYAHLQRFASRFQSIVDSTRLKNFSFEIDTLFNEQVIPVQQGEIIGYTGSTGVGPPHLHFELRDHKHRPFNALKTGLDVRDDLPPVFSELLAEPLKAGQLPQIKKPIAVTDNRDIKTYDFGVLKVEGPIGLALDVYDEVSQVTNKYAAYELLMIHENDTLFYSRLDSFSYHMDKQMFIDRAAAPGSSKKRFQRLYLKDGNTLPFYVKAENSHDVPFRSGNFTFIAKDYFGNASRGILRIEKEPKRNNSSSPNADNECLISTENGCYWTENWISTPYKNFIDLTNMVNYPQVSSTHFTGNTKQIHLAGPEYSHKIVRLNPSQSLKATINRHTTLYFPESSVFDTLSLSVNAYDNRITLFPEQAAIRLAYAIAHYLENTEAPVQSYGFYELDLKDNEYDYIESKVRGNTLWAYPRKTGIFVVKPDTVPPAARNPRIRKLGSIEVISVTAEDELSGIDYKNSFISVNGQRGILEYEPEDDRISFYHPHFVLKNTNFVELQLLDNVNNKATVNFIVEK